jgi:poly(3-hydroxybutyrate) depolymerase
VSEIAACRAHAGRRIAVVIVLTSLLLAAAGCRAPPQPIVYFHGTADPLVPINGEVVAGITVAPARQAMADWAAHNGCSAGPHQSPVTADVTLIGWSGCRDDADIDYYVIAGGGHSWPGAPLAIVRTAGLFYGHTTESISASQIMWDFFARRSRRAPGTAGAPAAPATTYAATRPGQARGKDWPACWPVTR